MANNKHLIIDDRITISQMLRERKSFKEIGESLNKDPSTISKEIRNHIILSKTGCHGHAYNNCIHRYTCDEACLCDECINRRLINRCRFCKQCNDHCDQYEPDSCLKLKKPPYVCNGCPDAHHKCTLEKHMYVAKEAQLSYEDTLHTCRTGINFSEDDSLHKNEYGTIDSRDHQTKTENHIRTGDNIPLEETANRSRSDITKPSGAGSA